ncbi:MAG: flagellar motor switch protein FliY [Helicobacteraceae bacterium]|jgi:flagellar motor switch protein FliN/FliY|nr:flagellar motor switch protein FliY [Helicobacteraceae bacterium]
MTFIELLQKEMTATVSSLVGAEPKVSLKSENTLNSLSSIVPPAVALTLAFSGAASGKGCAILQTNVATALADMMVGGGGAVKEVMEDEDIDATKEIVSQVFGAVSSSLAAQNELPKLSIKCESAEFIGDGSIELGKYAKMFTFNFEIASINSIVNVALDSTIADAISRKAENAPPNLSSAAPISSPPYDAPAPHISANLSAEEARNIHLLMDVRLTVRVRIGKKQMLLRDVINMDIGSIVELDQLANEPLDILVDNKKIAEGEVVIVDGNFGVQITSIGTKRERLEQLKG